MTTWEDMSNAVRSRFKAQVEDVESIQVQYDNAPFELDESSPLTDGLWVRFKVLPGQTDTAEFSGSKTARTPGVAMAQIKSEIEQGDRNALQLADNIKDAFRHVTAAGVVYQTPYVRTIGRVNENKWWQVNVICPFYSDDIE